MLQEQGIVKGDVHQQLGSVGFIIGVVLILVGSLLLPRAADISNVQEMQQVYGEQPVLLQACALLIAFGYWAVMAGTAGVYRSITANGAAWAHLGFYFHVVGVALWTIGMSLDISYPAAIVNWLTAPATDRETAYSVVAVLSPAGFGRGLFPMNVLVNWLAFALLGIGMIRSAVYPRWLGWFGLILGIAGLPLGITMTFTGREAILSGFVILTMVTIVWWLAVGVWVARRAW